uniref:Uncharacterized protein n=1 Tax=Lagenidium giganteum TaxID=4803 RepID=A0AAV2Z589_9STRA
MSQSSSFSVFASPPNSTASTSSSDSSSDSSSNSSRTRIAVELYHNTASLPTQPCVCPHPPRKKHPTVKATFPPAFCYHHRHHENNINRAGWGYITAEEARLISLLRRTDLLTILTDQLETDLTTRAIADPDINAS